MSEPNRIAILEKTLKRLVGDGCRVFQGLSITCITRGYDSESWCIGCVAADGLSRARLEPAHSVSERSGTK